MIVVDGEGSTPREITLTKNGERVVLNKDSDPAQLYSALVELATFITRQQKGLT